MNRWKEEKKMVETPSGVYLYALVTINFSLLASLLQRSNNPFVENDQRCLKKKKQRRQFSHNVTSISFLLANTIRRWTTELRGAKSLASTNSITVLSALSLYDDYKAVATDVLRDDHYKGRRLEGWRSLYLLSTNLGLWQCFEPRRRRRRRHWTRSF